MSRLLRDVDRVIAYCWRWGVRVRLEDVPADTLDGEAGFSAGPLHGWIESNGSDSTIWWPSPDSNQLAVMYGRALPHCLLHELSHCVEGIDPSASHEVRGPHLAFQLFSARYLGIRGWHAWMRNFAYDGGIKFWPAVPARKRSSMLRTSFKRAQQLGLLTEDGLPTFGRVLRRAA